MLVYKDKTLDHQLKTLTVSLWSQTELPTWDRWLAPWLGTKPLLSENDQNIKLLESLIT
jgi:hypothetical protein